MLKLCATKNIALKRSEEMARYPLQKAIDIRQSLNIVLSLFSWHVSKFSTIVMVFKDLVL